MPLGHRRSAKSSSMCLTNFALAESAFTRCGRGARALGDLHLSTYWFRASGQCSRVTNCWRRSSAASHNASPPSPSTPISSLWRTRLRIATRDSNVSETPHAPLNIAHRLQMIAQRQEMPPRATNPAIAAPHGQTTPRWPVTSSGCCASWLARLEGAFRASPAPKSTGDPGGSALSRGRRSYLPRGALGKPRAEGSEAGVSASDGGLHRSGIQCVGDDWLGADFLQYGCGTARLGQGEYFMLIRSQATTRARPIAPLAPAIKILMALPFSSLCLEFTCRRPWP